MPSFRSFERLCGPISMSALQLLLPSCSVGRRGVIGSTASVPLLWEAVPCKTCSAPSLSLQRLGCSPALRIALVPTPPGTLTGPWHGGLVVFVTRRSSWHAAAARSRRICCATLPPLRSWWRCRHLRPGLDCLLWTSCDAGDHLTPLIVLRWLARRPLRSSIQAKFYS